MFLSQTAQSATGTSTADLTKAVTELTLSSGSDACSLANGTVGQIKIFAAVGGSGTCTLTPTTLNGGTTITFNAAGDAATLLYVATVGWTIIGSNSVVVA